MSVTVRPGDVELRRGVAAWTGGRRDDAGLAPLGDGL